MRSSEGLFGRKEPPRGAAAPASPAPHSPAHAPLAAVPRAGSPPTPPAPAEAAHRADEGSGSRLIVGPNIKLKGVEIDDCDTLVVEGRVEASLDSRVIQIAEHGTFCGTVAIDVADIRGHFEGEITARKQLVVHASARMNGKIRYGALKVEEGAQLTGELSSLGGVAPLPAAPPKRVA